MHVEEKQAVKVSSTSSKTDDTSNHTFKYHEQFQRVDNFRMFSKILGESRCISGEDKYFIKQTNSSSKSIGTISAEGISTASIETRKNSNIRTYKTVCDTQNTIESSISANNIFRQLGHGPWKYKNSHNASACKHNIFKEDEHYKGKTKRNILSDCREYLANYQELCGTSRNEYSFAALITVMAQATVQSLWALLCVFVNTVSVIQIFYFILRFALDKVLNIQRTKNLQQITVKFAIFVVQLLSIHVCLIFIFGFIISPILQMAVSISMKLMANN